MEFIEVNNVVKTYINGEIKVNALNNVKLKIKHGEFVAITGPSGSGKSTLLHIIGGVDTPTSGNVVVDGVNICETKEKELAIFRRREIGFVFQFYNLIPILTVEENIVIPIKLDGQLVDEKRLDEIMNLLGLSDRRHHYPNQLSGGQQQRTAIARAIIYKPSIILADEPTGNLDTQNSREIIMLLKSVVKKYGHTLVLITHDPAIAAQADRTIFMKDGQVINGDAV